MTNQKKQSSEAARVHNHTFARAIEATRAERTSTIIATMGQSGVVACLESLSQTGRCLRIGARDRVRTTRKLRFLPRSLGRLGAIGALA
jgi:hypothetical protein